MNVRRPEWLEHPSNPRDAYSRLNQWANELGRRCSPRSLVITFAERSRVWPISARRARPTPYGDRHGPRTALRSVSPASPPRRTICRIRGHRARRTHRHRNSPRKPRRSRYGAGSAGGFKENDSPPPRTLTIRWPLWRPVRRTWVGPRCHRYTFTAQERRVCSRLRRSNRMISSRRLKNSGLYARPSPHAHDNRVQAHGPRWMMSGRHRGHGGLECNRLHRYEGGKRWRRHRPVWLGIVPR